MQQISYQTQKRFIVDLRDNKRQPWFTNIQVDLKLC